MLADHPLKLLCQPLVLLGQTLMILGQPLMLLGQPLMLLGQSLMLLSQPLVLSVQPLLLAVRPCLFCSLWVGHTWSHFPVCLACCPSHLPAVLPQILTAQPFSSLFCPLSTPPACCPASLAFAQPLLTVLPYLLFYPPLLLAVSLLILIAPSSSYPFPSFSYPSLILSYFICPFHHLSLLALNFFPPQPPSLFPSICLSPSSPPCSFFLFLLLAHIFIWTFLSVDTFCSHNPTVANPNNLKSHTKCSHSQTVV